MERLQRAASLAGTSQAYVCDVRSEYFRSCLDIAAPSTLGGSIVDAETGGITQTTLNDASILFGGSTECTADDAPGGVGPVGDGVVNSLDLAALLWYHFSSSPYDTLSASPSAVETVYPRRKTADRCGTAETQTSWTLATAEDYCHELGGRRRLQEAASATPRLDEDIDVDVWATIPQGTWYRVRMRDAPLSLELQLDSLYSGTAVALSNERRPQRGCRDCTPDDPTKPEIRFARHLEYEADAFLASNTLASKTPEIAAFTVSYQQKQRECASVMAGFSGSEAMRGSTLAIRQQPPLKACKVDLFVFKPDLVHSSPFDTACGDGFGVAKASQVLDGHGGKIQRSTTCAMVPASGATSTAAGVGSVVASVTVAFVGICLCCLRRRTPPKHTQKYEQVALADKPAARSASLTLLPGGIKL